MNKEIKIYPQTRALIFDIDGTLADTMPTHKLAFKKVLGGYGIELSDELFSSIAGVPVLPQMEMFKTMFKPKNFNPEVVAIEKEEEYFKTIDKMAPIKEVFDVLKAAYGKMPIGCGTGGDRKVAFKTLEVIGAIGMVEAVVTCDDVLNGKPHPETFLKCAKMLGVEPKFCQVFEDGEPGIEAAKAAGMAVTDVREYL